MDGLFRGVEQKAGEPCKRALARGGIGRGKAIEPVELTRGVVPLVHQLEQRGGIVELFGGPVFLAAAVFQQDANSGGLILLVLVVMKFARHGLEAFRIGAGSGARAGEKIAQASLAVQQIEIPFEPIGGHKRAESLSKTAIASSHCSSLQGEPDFFHPDGLVLKCVAIGLDFAFGGGVLRMAS